MRTIIFVVITLLSTLSTPVLACGDDERATLPSFGQVESAIADFLAQVYGHETMDGFRRYRSLLDIVGEPDRPIVDSWNAFQLISQRRNSYTLMGHPARLSTRRNSSFFGKGVVKQYAKLGYHISTFFVIGPEAYMGKIVLAHEIGHAFGFNEVEADVFATAYAGHDVWDMAEYYLMHNDAHWANEEEQPGKTAGNSYLSPSARLILIASVL